MVVNDDAAFEPFGHLAAFLGHTVQGQGRGRGGVQPLELAADAEAGFVEIAHRGLGHERGDVRRHPFPFDRLLFPLP